ncbi:MMPL family transporter [Shouchella sp. JSM 1781072]|uniref:MMPL family transporter n=1 Tax=Shouchella sp. JSM 1781072 TaxID=3344581 RepID=UPI0035C1BE13
MRWSSKPILIAAPILWVAATVLLLLFSPDLDRLVSEKGQIEIPDHYPTERYEALIQEDGGFQGQQVIVAYYEEDGLTEDQYNQIEEVVHDIEEDAGDIPLHNVVSPFDGEQQENQLLSDDEELVLVLLELDIEDEEYSEYRAAIDEKMQIDELTHYQTGAPVINEDMDQSIQDGLAVSQWITIALVFVVLLIVFRSPLAPIFPLLLLGTAYVFSISAVSILVEWFDFPISSYTQIFIMAVVFGVGTDYCILLMRRFQEELISQNDSKEAMLVTFKASSKTVLYGAITGFIGFATIIFAEFNIFQSAVGVSVGVLVLVLGIWALLPSIMAGLGQKMFWPSKPKDDGENNWLWRKMGRFSIYRPGYALLLVFLIVTPLMLYYDNDVSFNNVEEIDESYDSIYAYDLIADKFGEGEIFFTTLAVETPEETWANPNSLPYLELMALNLEKIEEVDQVRTVTRPEGERTDLFTVPEQADQLADMIREAINGLDEVMEGHDDLIQGVEEADRELDQVGQGITDLQSGVGDAQDGAAALQSGLAELGTELSEAQTAVLTVSNEITTYQEQVQGLANEFPDMQEIETALNEAEELRTSLLQSIDERQQQLAELQTIVAGLAFDPNVFDVGLRGQLDSWEQTVNELRDQAEAEAGDTEIPGLLQQLEESLQTGQGQLQEAITFVTNVEETRAAIEGELASAVAELTELRQLLTFDTPLNQIDVPSPDGIANEINEELGAIQTQTNELAAGLGEAVTAISTLGEGADEIGSGLGEVQAGLSDLAAGMDSFEDALNEFSSGIREAQDGVDDVRNGLTDLESFTDQIANQPAHPLEGIFISEDMLQEEEFDQLWEHYATPDNKVVSLIEVTLHVDPYQQEAINAVNEIEDVAKFSLKDTPFEDATVLVSGISAQNRDLQDITNQDFLITASIMLVGIFIALVVLFRSLIMPLYVLFSLVATYFSAAAITEFIFTGILDYQGLMWPVPFFGFVLLMALGVDYSIFLLTRFDEELKEGHGFKVAMHEGMKKIGGTVLSAALILGGTFASMLASGVLTLMQVSTLVVIGLLFYCVILLPLFVPAIGSAIGSKNWWPFKNKVENQKREEQ